MGLSKEDRILIKFFTYLKVMARKD